MQIIEMKMSQAHWAKVIGNLSAAAAMIGEAARVLNKVGGTQLVFPLSQAGKICTSIADVFIAAQPQMPKEKTMATATKKTTTKKASKPLAKGLKAVKAMKPAKKVAK